MGRSRGKLSSLPGGERVLLGVEEPGLMSLDSRDMVSTLLDVGLSIISSCVGVPLLSSRTGVPSMSTDVLVGPRGNSVG